MELVYSLWRMPCISMDSGSPVLTVNALSTKLDGITPFISLVLSESQINRFTRGWVGYFRLSKVQQQFDTLDQWMRRRLRKILWEQWRKPKTRCRKLIALGLEAARARKATATGLGAWWNAGASHMHAAVNNRVLAEWGLRSLLDQLRVTQRST